MHKLLVERLRQGYRTLGYPADKAPLPPRFRGWPRLEPRLCCEPCRDCDGSCPTGALGRGPLRIDLSRCLFCGSCQRACTTGAIRFSSDHELAARRREALEASGGEHAAPVESLGAPLRKLLGRSLRLRQVSAGGCNGCEAELVALGNVVFDASRFGIQFVASPRHADGIVVTGPVTCNMGQALRATYDATPRPKIVVAVGACALSGGPFAGGAEILTGLPSDLPVDLFVPGCPPHPLTILHGLLRLLGRLRAPTRVSASGA